MHELTVQQARRIAVRAQLLDAPRPTDLLGGRPAADAPADRPDGGDRTERRPRAVEPARIGLRPGPAEARRGAGSHPVRAQRHDPARGRRRPLPRRGRRVAGVRAHPRVDRGQRAFRRDILALLAASGPLNSKDIPDTCAVPWTSTGWTHNRNVTQMLECMMMRGEVAISGREGRQRLWDLAERVYPPGVAIPRRGGRAAEGRAAARRARHRPREEHRRGGRPVRRRRGRRAGHRRGRPGEWRVDPALLAGDFAGRTALLSPFDRLVHDRVACRAALRVRVRARDVQAGGGPPLGLLRAADPARRAADREAGCEGRPQGVAPAVYAIHEDVPFTKAMTKGVQAELDDLAAWIGVDLDA